MAVTDERFEFARRRLTAGEPVVLMLVVSVKGSTPGKPGFKVVVDRQGGHRGTIGGGIMELNLLDRAREMLADGQHRPELVTQVHHKNAPLEQQSGMICAGTQWLLLVPMTPADLPSLANICTSLSENRPGLLEIDPGGWRFVEGASSPERHVWRDAAEQPWQWREILGMPDTVHVIGSGHVGLAVCRTLSLLDLRVVAYDHRAEVDTFTNNTWAAKKVCLPYEALGDHIEEGPYSYVVIVTTAFHTDAAALQAVIHKDLRYLGLMGSAAKIREIYRTLKAAGTPEDLLAKVRAPIGIPIGPETPAEIAVSIAAEIVQERRRPPGEARTPARPGSS
ncbi:XdhC family protein [Sulfidibacter corallicola]